MDNKMTSDELKKTMRRFSGLFVMPLPSDRASCASFVEATDEQTERWIDNYVRITGNDIRHQYSEPVKANG